MKTYALRRKMLTGLIVSTMGLSLAAGALYAAGEDRATTPPGAAQQQPGTPPTAAQPRATMPQGGTEQVAAAQDMRASELIGMRVVNAQGENLGEINDVIVDVTNERVHYAILGFGGVLGLGEKLFAYPVKSFQPGPEEDQLVLNVSKDALDQAPGFERQNWPDWNRDDYRERVDRHFGPTVSIGRMPDQRLVRASELIGSNVDDMEGRRAGKIEDVVVNLESGEVPYAVLDLDTSWGTDDIFVPISISALEVGKDGDRDLTLTLPRKQIDVERGFTEDAWPDGAPENRPTVNGQRRTS